MTGLALDAERLHDLTVLDVGDLSFTVAPPSARCTLEVIVDRDASLIVLGPSTATVEQVRAFVVSKRPWIYRRLAEKDALTGPPIVKQFVNGEGFAYLGRSYRLLLEETAEGVRLDRGRFVMSRSTVSGRSDAMRQWYVQTGRTWLRRRVEPWAARAGAAGVRVDVRDLGYRWGSARPARDAAARINVHWATLQLPPSLIDYVLVHELAHLREANHTPEYWRIVERLMPGYDSYKRALAGIGKNVWLGQTAE